MHHNGESDMRGIYIVVIMTILLKLEYYLSYLLIVLYYYRMLRITLYYVRLMREVLEQFLMQSHMEVTHSVDLLLLLP